MFRSRLIGYSVVVGLAMSGWAAAETAYTVKTVNLRAGPARDYPVVDRLPAGAPVEVAGCLEDYAWCDVIAGPNRGWVYSGNLEYPYEGSRAIILNVGPSIGFPIVPFSVGPYWDTYYRSRPWYGRRSYWSSRPLSSHRVWVRPPGSRYPGRDPVFRPGRPSGPRPSGIRPQPRSVAPRPVVQPRHGERRRPEARPAPARPNQPNRPNRPNNEKRGDRKH